MVPDPPPDGWPNPRPDAQRFFHSVYFLLVLFLAAIAVDVVAFLLPSFRGSTPSSVLVLVPIGFFVPLMGLWVFEQRALWEHTPDQVVLESDRIVGVFEPHVFVRKGRIRKVLPYADVTKEVRDGLASLFSFRFPIMAVWADRLIAEQRPSFDYQELRRPPEERSGYATCLKLNLENYARFEAARGEWRARASSATSAGA